MRLTQSRHTILRWAGIAAAAVLLIILALPVTVTCGAPGYSCTPAPDEQGIIWRHYDIEPLGVMLLETALGTDLPLRYSSGRAGEPLRGTP